jgi:hypothetical protein
MQPALIADVALWPLILARPGDSAAVRLDMAVTGSPAGHVYTGRDRAISPMNRKA